MACIVFLCFQVFLVGFLDQDAHLGLRRGARPRFGLESDELRAIDMPGRWTGTTHHPPRVEHKLESDCRSHNCSIADKLPVDSVREDSDTNVAFFTSRQLGGGILSSDSRSVELSQFENVWQFLEHRFPRPAVSEQGTSANFTRGVNRRWRYLYEGDERMQFTCILSEVYIPVFILSI